MGLDQLSAPAPEQERVWIKWPKSRFLLNLCYWLAFSCVWKFGFILDSRPQTATEVVGQLILGTFSSYFGGAIWSEFPFVWGIALVAALAFLLTVLVPSLQSRQVAKVSFGAIIVLSLFTLWIEEYMTIWGVVRNVAMSMAKVSLLIPNIVVTVVWLYGWRKVVHLVDQELPAPGIVMAGVGDSTALAGSPARLSWASLPPRTGQWLLISAGSFAIFFLMAIVLQSVVPLALMFLCFHPLAVAITMSRLESEELRNRWRTAGWFGATIGLKLACGLGLGVLLALLNG